MPMEPCVNACTEAMTPAVAAQNRRCQTGVQIALFQALTQIQEMTLTFVPKIIAILLVTSVTAPFVGAVIFAFADSDETRGVRGHVVVLRQDELSFVVGLEQEPDEDVVVEAVVEDAQHRLESLLPTHFFGQIPVLHDVEYTRRTRHVRRQHALTSASGSDHFRRARARALPARLRVGSTGTGRGVRGVAERR